MEPEKIMRALCKNGYDGLILDDHVPFLTVDSRWGHTARADAFVYLNGMKKMLEWYEK